MPIPKQFLMQNPDGFASLLHADSQANLPRPDGRLVATDNELGVLLSIGHFGHLRTSEIAGAVWPDSPAASGLKMARRTVRRLLAAQAILARPNSLGSMSFVLTKRGAARLRSLGFEARDGYDIQGVQGPTFWHRTLATAYLVSQARTARVYGEFAIAKARHVLGKSHLLSRYGKLPDGLVLLPGAVREMVVEHVAVWVEVESSFKADLELEKLLRQAWQLGHFMDARERILLDEMAVVYDRRAGHLRRLVRMAQRIEREDIRRREAAGESGVSAEDYRPIWGSIRLVAADISPPLHVRGWQEATLLDCMEG